MNASPSARRSLPLWLCLLLSAALAALAACSDNPPPYPAISVQPADTAASVGSAATLSVSASGIDLRYQWQQSSDAGATWADIAGATQASHTTPPATLADNGQRFRVVVAGAGLSVTSSAVMLTVTAVVVAPSIGIEPAAQSVTAGQDARFSVTAAGTALAYQWQRSTDAGASFAALAGATQATLNLSAVSLADDGQRFRVVVSNSAGRVTSSALLLTVTAAATTSVPAFGSQPADVAVTAGQSAQLAVAVSGTPAPTLQWQMRTNPAVIWSDLTIDGVAQTGTRLDIAATTLAQNGFQFRVLASNSAGVTTSNVVTLTVNAATVAPSFTTQPLGVAIVEGQNAQFTVAAAGTPTPALQWQFSSDGSNWNNINGATAAVFDVIGAALANNGRRFRAVASNSAGAVNSQAATLTVNAAPVPAVIAYEGFDYPLGDRLLGKSGGSGWAGAWGVASDSGAALDISQSGIIASGLRYTDSAGNDLLTTGGAWQTDAGVAYGQALRATSASTGTGGSTRWVSFLVKQAAPSGGYNVAAATLGTGYVLGNGVVTGGLGSDLSPFLGCFLCTSSNTPIPGFAAGSVAMVLIRYDFTASGNDVVGLWINPPLDPSTSLGTPTLSAVGNFAEVMNALTLAWGNSRSFTFDELRIAATRDAAAPFTPAPSSAGTSVFFTDFEAPLPPQIAAGTALIEGVQGFAGLGPTGNTIAGSMLRSETGNTVTLTLTGLPPHSWLSLDLLFAAIDSLDGSGAYPSGDFFRITLDGVDIFRESFANALASQIQTYVPPPGVELARRVELGFWAAYPESAYWLGGDAIFRRIPHTGSSAVITLRIEGAGIQSLGDESWGIDNLGVRVGP